MIDLTHIKNLYTHAGTFHSDDVFSTALLRILGCSALLHRVAVLPKLTETDLAYDIGFGLSITTKKIFQGEKTACHMHLLGCFAGNSNLSFSHSSIRLKPRPFRGRFYPTTHDSLET